MRLIMKHSSVLKAIASKIRNLLLLLLQIRLLLQIQLHHQPSQIQRQIG
jgi:hypothetical protein